MSAYRSLKGQLIKRKLSRKSQSTTSKPIYDLTGKRIWVAGHRGMVGSALVRRLKTEPCEILMVGRDTVDLRRQETVERWMAETNPDVVVLAAATVGGILAKRHLPGGFSLRRSGDRDQHYRGGAPHQRQEIVVPRILVHLSAARATADA